MKAVEGAGSKRNWKVIWACGVSAKYLGKKRLVLREVLIISRGTSVGEDVIDSCKAFGIRRFYLFVPEKTGS